ncbi:MAG: TlpA family protein disulfide reductase [Gammaproteobacteria bacterium]|nr:TlpA family protein disulfide reductase [Gammaproteobacteria bacterium]MDE2138871.1 TlpA family protein disulfide reductase [Gammaproteobacteria bacterium]
MQIIPKIYRQVIPETVLDTWSTLMTIRYRSSKFMLWFSLSLAMLIPVFAYANPKAGAVAPAATFTSQQNKSLSLTAYHGQKVMLWLFSTWCPSCQAGLGALAQEQQALAAGHVRLIVLENYRNGGYPGPTMQELLNQYASTVKDAPNWTIGNATRELAAVYNAKSYPDIYYLIGADGKIETVGSAPSASMNEILTFARK